MNVLVINCGSSSLKFQLINYDNRDVMARERARKRSKDLER